MVFKIFLVLFSLLAIGRTVSQYSARQVSKYWLALMMIVWTLVIVVAVVPEWTDILARFVGVGRGADLLIYLAILGLIWSYHRVLIRQHQLQRELTDLVSHLAILEGEKELKKV